MAKPDDFRAGVDAELKGFLLSGNPADLYDEKNPFAGGPNGFIAQKGRFVDSKIQSFQASNNNATPADVEKFNKQAKEDFDKEELPKLAKQRYEESLAAYDNKNVDVKVDGLVSNVAKAGVGSALTLNNPIAGMQNAARGGILAFIMGLPLIGNLIAQISKFIGIKFLGHGRKEGEKTPTMGEAWSQAGHMVEQKNVTQRMVTSLGGVSDTGKLAAMIERASHYKSPPASGAALLDTDGDGKLTSAELNLNDKDKILNDEDKKLIEQKIGIEPAKALFKHLEKQGVTFANQNISEVAVQTLPDLSSTSAGKTT